MVQYISKSAVLAEIRKYKNNAEAYLKYHHNRNDKSVYAFEQEKLAMCELLSFLDTLEVQEEPVSEDLKKAAKQYSFYIPTQCEATETWKKETEQHFKDGAKWQLAKNKSITLDDLEKFINELSKQFSEVSFAKVCKIATRTAKWKEQQMMKDAVAACVTGIRTYKEENETDFTVMYEKGIIPYEIEQEVKLIIIKED